MSPLGFARGVYLYETVDGEGQSGRGVVIGGTDVLAEKGRGGIPFAGKEK